MTTKDYELIARAINEAIAVHEIETGEDSKRSTDPLNRVARFLATDLAEQNLKFNRAKFLAACGISE